MPKPLVSCVVPTTVDRRWCLPLAIRQYMRQGSPAAMELVVVFSGGGGVGDIIEAAGRDDVRLVTVPELSLGRKFNAAVDAAFGEIILLWADDDWHHPDRVSAALAAIPDATEPMIAGQHTALFHELHEPGRTYAYRSPDESFVGGTCAFTRTAWRRVPFPDRPSGVDTMWLYAAHKAQLPRVAMTGPPYVAFQHGQTTGRKTWPPTGQCWKPYDNCDGDVAGLLGDDLNDYQRAYAARCPAT